MVLSLLWLLKMEWLDVFYDSFPLRKAIPEWSLLYKQELFWQDDLAVDLFFTLLQWVIVE